MPAHVQGPAPEVRAAGPPWLRAACAADRGQALVEDPDRGVGLRLGQHQRRREAHRVAAGAEDQHAARERLVHDRVAFGVARSLVCRSRTSSTPIISPLPRTSPISGCLSCSARSPACRCAPTSAAFATSDVAQQPDRGQRRRARHRVAAKRAGVRPGRPVHHLGPGRGDAERQARRDALGRGRPRRARPRSARSPTSCRCGPSPTAPRRPSAACRAGVVSSRSR